MKASPDPDALVLNKQHTGRQKPSSLSHQFQLLQQSKGEALYVVFDCLYAGGTDLRKEPLSARRRALEKVVPAGGVLLLSRRLSANRLEADKLAKRRGYEGLVAKDLSSPYVERRSRYWLKVKVHQEDEFVIVGITAPEGSRQHFGALRLGVYEGGTLRYPKLPGGPPIAGRSGTGHIWAEDGRPWLVAPNLTSDPETGAARWTDDMLARAIREGISHDGRMQHPQIWYTAFSSLSDEDLASVVVYIRSLMHTTALPGIFGCCCVSIGPWSITGAKC